MIGNLRARGFAMLRLSIACAFHPFGPHARRAGCANPPHVSWNYFDRLADEWLDEHWQRRRPALYEKAQLTPL